MVNQGVAGSYADLLKSIRTNVAPDSRAEHSIKTIRKTKQGGVIIVVDRKDKDILEVLKKNVERHGTINARIASSVLRNVNFTIKDIDGITTIEEVERVLIKEGGVSKGSFTLSN